MSTTEATDQWIEVKARDPKYRGTMVFTFQTLDKAKAHMRLTHYSEVISVERHFLRVEALDSASVSP